MGLPPDIANLTGPPPGAPPAIPIGGPGGPGADLGGGPAPGAPPDLGGGLPPELAAALGGPGGPAPGGPPTGPDQGKSSKDHLADARDSLSAAFDAEKDDVDKKAIAAALKTVQDLFAAEQQQHEAAGGITPAHKGMAKALGR